MKKYLQSLFVFIYILLFFLIYQNFVTQDESNLHNLFGGIEKYERGSIVFDESIDEHEIKDIVEKAETLSKDQDIAVQFLVYDRKEDGGRGSLEYYVAANDDYIKSYLPKGASIPKNFLDSNYYFTTEKTSDPNAIFLFSYYKDLSFTLKPIHMAKENTDFILEDLEYYYTLGHKNVDKIVFDTFKDYKYNYMQIGSFQFNKDSSIRNLFIYYSFITLALSMLYILFKISDSAKEIMVYKLQGYNVIHIIYLILKSEFYINLASFILVPFIGALIVFKGFNYRMIEFFKYNYFYLGLLLLIFIMCALVGLIFLQRQKISDLLKNKNFNEGLITITFVLAIFVSISIMPKIEQPIGKLIDIYDTRKYIDNHQKKVKDYQEMWLKLTKDRSFEFDSRAITGEVDDPVYEKHKDIYNYLNSKGLVIKQRINYYKDEYLLDEMGEDDLDYLGYQINEKYFSLLDLYDGKSKINKPKLEDGNIYVFIARDLYSNSSWKRGYFTTNKNVGAKIILYDKAIYPDFSINKPNDDTYQPIFVLEKDGSNFLDSSLDSGLYIKNKDKKIVEDYLESNNVIDSIGFIPNKTKIENSKANLNYNTLSQMIEIIPAIFLLLMTLLVMKHFYLKANEKAWSVYKSLGYDSLQVVKIFILELGVIFVLTLSYYRFIVKQVPIYTISVLGFILIMNSVMIVFNYKNLDINKKLG